MPGAGISQRRPRFILLNRDEFERSWPQNAADLSPCQRWEGRVGKMRQTDPRHDAAFRLRIAKSLAMVSADNDNLALVAAKTADRLVRDAGISWIDLICPQLPDPKWQPEQQETDDLFWCWPARWHAAVEFCCANLHRLSERDIDFVISILGYHRIPSEKQLVWLQACVTKVQAKGGRP